MIRPDQPTRPILWTLGNGNPRRNFTVPENCAHAKENRAHFSTTSLANSLKNYGQHEWLRS